MITKETRYSELEAAPPGKMSEGEITSSSAYLLQFHKHFTCTMDDHQHSTSRINSYSNVLTKPRISFYQNKNNSHL